MAFKDFMGKRLEERKEIIGRKVEQFREKQAVKKIESERLRKITEEARAAQRETEARRYGELQAKREYEAKSRAYGGSFGQLGARATGFLGNVGQNLTEMGFGVGIKMDTSMGNRSRPKKGKKRYPANQRRHRSEFDLGFW